MKICETPYFGTKVIFIISIFLSLLLLYCYNIGCIQGIRGFLSDIISFISPLMSIITIFFSLLLALENSPLFVRLKKHTPSLPKEIYSLLQFQMFNSLFLFSAIIIIKMFKTPTNLYYRNFSLSIFFFSLVFLVFSLFLTFYSLYTFVISATNSNTK